MIKSLKSRSVKFAATCLLLTSTLGAATYSMADTATPPAATAPAAEASGVPTPPPLPANTVTVSNPYGLQALWNGGDLVAKSTLFILVIMSIGSWYIILSKLLEQTKLAKQGKEAERHFWEADTLDKAPANLTDGSAYRFIAEKGIGATKHHGDSLLERIDFNTWVTISIQRAIEKVQSHLSGGLAFLATVGSTAPFVGLFGTVWGIYNALTAIGIAGQASIDKVAGPVGESLIMTAFGLAVAVPAVLGYNWLVRRNKTELEKVRSFGSDLHSVILSGDINKVSK